MMTVLGYPHDRSIEMARQALPKMPLDVFELWFAPEVRTLGWPPEGTEWRGVLRLRGLEYWASLDWELQEVTIDSDTFTDSAREILGALVAFLVPPHHLSRFVTATTTDKLNRLLRYAREHGAIPHPLVLVKDGGSIEIADGCHRLAVVLGGPSLARNPVSLGLHHMAWVGTPGLPRP